MIVVRHLLWSLRRCFSLVSYYVTMGIRSHRDLARIDAHFVGVIDMFALEAAAEAAWLKLLDPAAAALVHFYGGSTHGAFLSDEETRRWINHVILGLGIQYGIWAAHYHVGGRFDFHILAANTTVDGRRLHTAELVLRVRTLAREATEMLNQARLAAGRLTIGNLTAEGEVYFLSGPAPQQATPLADVEPQAKEAVAKPKAMANIPPHSEPTPAPKPKKEAAAVAPRPANWIDWEERTRLLLIFAKPASELTEEERRRQREAARRIRDEFQLWLDQLAQLQQLEKLGREKSAAAEEFRQHLIALNAHIAEQRLLRDRPHASEPGRD